MLQLCFTFCLYLPSLMGVIRHCLKWNCSATPCSAFIHYCLKEACWSFGGWPKKGCQGLYKPAVTDFVATVWWEGIVNTILTLYIPKRLISLVLLTLKFELDQNMQLSLLHDISSCNSSPRKVHWEPPSSHSHSHTLARKSWNSLGHTTNDSMSIMVGFGPV